MARDLPELDDFQSTITSSPESDNDRNTGLLGRRSYLKLAGAAAAATGATGVGSAAGVDYDVFTLAPGERRVVRLDDGETFENVVFDQRAEGASATVVAYGTNWTIRNVAWRGPMAGTYRAIGCGDTKGGRSRIENVYLGDGVDPTYGGRADPKLGIWVTPDHSGHIDFERIYVEGAHDNAFYASAPGSNSNGRRGTVHFKNCYAKDNWVAGFRLARGVVENCVAVNTAAGRDGRPLWVWNTDEHDGRVEVYDSDFIAGAYPYALDIGRSGGRCEIFVENTNWSGTRRLHPDSDVEYVDGGENGTDATDRIPKGCPTSVDAVFEGMTSTDSYDHILELAGQFSYRVEVDGELAPATRHAKYLTHGDAYGDDWAEWWLSGGDEAFTTWRFSGDVTSLDVSDYDGETEIRAIRIDGEEVDPAQFGIEQETHTLELAGQFSYRVEVDGEIEPSDPYGEWVTEGEAYGNGWAEWWLSGSEDARTAWRITGDITSLELTAHDGVTDVEYVRIDGEEVNHDEFLRRRDDLLVIHGSEAGSSRYEFTVDGAVEPSTVDGATIDEADAIDGDTVVGTVANWYDAFAIQGTIRSLTIDGPATATLGGEPVNSDALGPALPHVLEVEGTDSPATYEVTVDGVVAADDGDSTTADGVYSDSTVERTIATGRHRFRFSGSLTDVSVPNGDVRLLLDGERVYPTAIAETWRPHALVLEAVGDEETVSYEVVVDGSIRRSADAAGRDEPIGDDGTIEGIVGTDPVAFWFDGTISSLRADGAVIVDAQYDVRNR